MGEFQLTDYIQYALALLFVLALIGILATLAKRTGFAGALPRHRSRDRRLSISEVLALDGKRRLILLRRDTTEHLVIIGPNSETVVETGISAPSENFASAALSVARQEPQLRGAKMLAPSSQRQPQAKATPEPMGRPIPRNTKIDSSPAPQRRPGLSPSNDRETPA